jgi:hypothetical protein
VRHLALILFAAIALLSFERPLTDVVTRYDALRADFTRQADRAPQFTEFIEGVRARTKRGDSIALVAFTAKREIYGYCYLRASYLLAGRRVLTTFTPEFRFDPAAIQQAQYTAAFGTHVPTGQAIWRHGGGELVRQR